MEVVKKRDQETSLFFCVLDIHILIMIVCIQVNKFDVFSDG